MKPTANLQQGTLALMVPKAPDFPGPLRGPVIARRIEQIRGDRLALNQEIVPPLRLRTDPEGVTAAEWESFENSRRSRFYRVLRAGRKPPQVELQGCQQTADTVSRLLTINAETQSCSR